uniref:Uncharacterized protein n=1 Tax=Ciona intestinalis TaxID=7719 RepID=H2XXB5_CIOIN
MGQSVVVVKLSHPARHVTLAALDRHLPARTTTSTWAVLQPVITQHSTRSVLADKPLASPTQKIVGSLWIPGRAEYVHGNQTQKGATQIEILLELIKTDGAE